ncbi:META domain-containing protein [Streptomyces sp. NPDC056144]|uniref:META domain-containing protein n=1 Tax=unclassified Streptomyces TaxID=2593676 RepID=UPI0035DCCB06
MPKPRAALAALVPLALLLAACGTAGGRGATPAGTLDPGIPLAGTYWTIDAVTIDGRKAVAPPGAHVEFAEDGSAKGSTGCNAFGVSAAVDGSTVTVTQQEISMMACTGDRGRFERDLIAAFSGPLKATVKGERLTLASADGARSLALTSEPDAPLRGTTWKIDSLVSGDSASSLPEGSGAKAKFTIGEDGRVSGNLGCNNFSAAARVDGTTLTVEGPAATTRMICTPPQMRLETKLYELLDGPLTYRLNHRTLTLTDASGEGLGARAEG